MQTGKIGVTTENIFPIIKKFLYSEHDIFLRELVSNAVDATQKLKTLARLGKYSGSTENASVRVIIDKEAGTITIADQGIGMTADEIDKYINQIAFSGANEFLDKYKDTASSIIGHFGLGFYSSFMVSTKVVIVSRSYQDGAQAVRWECDGSPDYTLQPAERAEVGTDIVLYLDEESKTYLEDSKLESVLTKYCKFLPIPIIFGAKKEWDNEAAEEKETGEDNIINNTQPAWVRRPADLKEEDYSSFYRELYPMGEEPLFNIHLNVDHPFTLTGILYFPRIKTNLEIQKNKIQLYCSQVFVTDSVEGIVPDFLTLLHGVLDSPDIPLNVSRSYLQGDPNVAKISGHISKKVADRLHDIFKNTREDFEKKWDDLKMFIQYGMITDQKFYERAEKFALFKNMDGKYFTFEEYRAHILEKQTDKDGKLAYLYTTDPIAQHSYIEKLRAKGYDVLLMDGHLDAHFINNAEQKFEKSQFLRVDADTAERIIKKDSDKGESLSAQQKDVVRPAIESHLPETGFYVQFENLGADESPVVITQSEFMRRMKDMAKLNGGMGGMYGNLPDSYTLVINEAHPLIKRLSDDVLANNRGAIETAEKALAPLRSEKDALDKLTEGKKYSDITPEEREKKNEVEENIRSAEKLRNETIKTYAKGNDKIQQLVDLALISNNMLKGEALSNFVKRSIDLLS